MTLKPLLCMTAYRRQAKSTSNPAVIAAIKTARSHQTILLAAVGERKWQTINHKNLAVMVRFAFLMSPFGSITQLAPSPSRDKCRVIHLLVVSLSDGSRKNWLSLTICQRWSNSAVRGVRLTSTSSLYRDGSRWQAGRYQPECHVLGHALVGYFWRGQPSYQSLI